MVKKVLNVTGYMVLVFFTFLLFFRTIPVALAHNAFPALVLLALIVAGLLYQVGVEFADYIRLRGWIYKFGKEDFFNFISVFGGALVTYVLSVNLDMGPVVAAGLVGVLIALIKPKYGVPVYCGSFVGMACPDYLAPHPLLFAGVVAGTVYVISSPVFNGFGGKLGTIAFAGCIIAGSILSCELQSAPVPGWTTGRLIVFYSVLAAVVTYYLSVYLKHGPVMASGIVGLAGGLVLPVVYPTVGTTLGVIVICSSFAGMSSSERFPRIYQMVLAGFFAGVVFLFSMPYLGGAGGKLGTIAFGSVIALRGLMDLPRVLATRFAKVPAAAEDSS